MRTHVKKVWINVIRTTFLVQMLCLESFSYALAPRISSSDATIPQFWSNQEEVNSPEQAWEEMRGRVLNDEANRIADEFKIPEALRKRTEFWFDIYTRYGSN